MNADRAHLNCPRCPTLLLHLPRGWLIANLLAQIGFGLLAMTVCLPSMQSWATTFGASQAAVQLTFSAYLVTYGALQLVYGPLSDRHGRRPVLIFGVALAGVGSVLAALAPSLDVLILARALQGAGSAAGMVVGRYGVGPEGIGWYIMAIPLSYILGNYLTSHWVHRLGERRMMALGLVAAVSGLVLLLALGGAGWHNPLAFALPLLLLGLGHGFLNPPALAGTVAVVPALAGSAAAVAGLMQQLMGAAGGYVVGLVSHQGTINLGCLMLMFTLCSVLAFAMLQRR